MKYNNEFIHVLLNKARYPKLESIERSRISLRDAFLQTEAELKRLNSLVRNKKVNDTHLGNSIFRILKGEVIQSDIDNYASDHLTAAYYTLLKIKERLMEENNFNFYGIRRYGFIISSILFDLIPFANHIGKKKDASYIFFEGQKNNIEATRWHYLGTFQLIYNCIFEKKMLDDKFAMILSPVALRQTIELKIQRVFGVGEYYDLKGKKIYTHHRFFFDLIKKNKNLIKTEHINLKVIQKIFEFCNHSVHKGVMPFFWQMFYAIKFCDPLFHDRTDNKKDRSLSGSIKLLDYNALKKNVEAALTEKFPSPQYSLYINWINPEASIINKVN